MNLIACLLFLPFVACYTDPRDYMQSPVMFQDGYTDQPYCVYNTFKTPSEWSCVITGQLAVGEGVAGEHVMSVVSIDDGETWEGPFDVEVGVPDGVPNAYGNIVYAPKLDRLYTVYNLNLYNVTSSGRNDELGFFFMKYSEDGGRSWSADRYLVPYPSTWVDRQNNFNGTTRIMWTVDHVKIRDGTVYFAFTKIGNYVQNPPEEVFVMSSDNLLSEPDANYVSWRMFPEGDHGITAPDIYDVNKTVNEEGHVFPLTASEGFYTLARTDKGYLATSSTSDPTGRTGWSPTTLAQYWDNSLTAAADAPVFKPLNDVTDPVDQKVYLAGIKSPRGPFTPKMLIPHEDHPEYGDAGVDSRYLMLFYNNRAEMRNPYFLSAGVESNGAILWSQPEVAIYDRETHDGTSAGGYPDIMQMDDGALRITSAQKGLPTPCTVRIISVSEEMVGGLLNQHLNDALPEGGSEINDGDALPDLPEMANITEDKQGWNVMLKITNFAAAAAGDVLLESEGFVDDFSVPGLKIDVATPADDAEASSPKIRVSFADGAHVFFSQSIDGSCAAMLADDGEDHFFAINADAGPMLVTWMVDGVLCDGGGVDGSGYKWIDPLMGGVEGGAALSLNSEYVLKGMLFTRSLTTSEMVGAYRSV